MKSLQRGGLAALAGSLTVALALTACSSGGTSTSDAGGNTSAVAGGASTSACVAQAKTVVDAASKSLPVSLPVGPLDLSKMGGKKVWMINAINNPLLNAIAAGFKDAATAAGASATIFDGKGQVNTWNTGVNQAVSQKANGIVLVGIEPALVANGLKAAKAAGIPVVDVFSGSPGDPLADGVVAHVNPDFTHSGVVVADWMLVDSNCNVHAALFGQYVTHLHVQIMDSITATLKANCPSCTVDRQNVDSANFSTDIQNKVPNTLRRLPNTNYLVPVYDAATTFAIPAAATAGFKGKLIGHDGVSANLDLVRSGKQALDLSFPPNAWEGWAAADALFRPMTGAKAVTYTIPTQLLDKSNIGASNDDLFPLYKDFQSQFVAEWKKSS